MNGWMDGWMHVYGMVLQIVAYLHIVQRTNAVYQVACNICVIRTHIIHAGT